MESAGIKSWQIAEGKAMQECNECDEINWLVHDKVIAWCELPSIDLS